MQQTATLRMTSRKGVQVLLIAAVALAGVSVGRWLVPDASSETISQVHTVVVTGRSPGNVAAIERKIEQMDGPEVRTGNEPTAVAGLTNAPAPSRMSGIEQKLDRMDR